jgi:hypothetical protein
MFEDFLALDNLNTAAGRSFCRRRNSETWLLRNQLPFSIVDGNIRRSSNGEEAVPEYH